MPNHKLSTNVCLEKIHSVFQKIIMSMKDIYCDYTYVMIMMMMMMMMVVSATIISDHFSAVFNTQ